MLNDSSDKPQAYICWSYFLRPQCCKSRILEDSTDNCIILPRKARSKFSICLTGLVFLGLGRLVFARQLLLLLHHLNNNWIWRFGPGSKEHWRGNPDCSLFTLPSLWHCNDLHEFQPGSGKGPFIHDVKQLCQQKIGCCIFEKKAKKSKKFASNFLLFKLFLSFF